MFDQDTSLSPMLTDDDDTLSPWDDADDLPLSGDDDSEDSVVPKPIKPLVDEEEDEEEDEFGLLPEDLEEDM